MRRSNEHYAVAPHRARSGKATIRPGDESAIELSLRRQPWLGLQVLAQNFVVLMEKPRRREKSFRAQSLHYVDAGGACRREHRSDYRRA
jgi:hypothetical protein